MLSTNSQKRLAHCQKCFAILSGMRRNEKRQIHCPVCGVRYDMYGKFQIEQFQSYFRNHDLYIEFEDISKHSQQLASIASTVNGCHPDYPPMRALLAGMNEAQHFIDAITFGISHIFIGAFKLVAQRVKVRLIVSIPPDQFSLLPELQSYQQEAPNLSIKAVCASSHNWEELPHQKLVVIDGLLAFKGSVNLKQTAWRKAARGYDEVESVTDIDKVIDLHNRYFSPIWADLSDEYGNAIAIRHHPLIDDIAA